MTATPVEPKRPVLTDLQLSEINRDELVLKWRELEQFTNQLHDQNEQNIVDAQNKLDTLNTHKSLEIAKLKNIILMKYVASKEQESTSQFKESQHLVPVKPGQQVVSFVDPSVNAMIVELKKELDETRKKKEDLQLELDSWKFNPESQIIKRLMAKCRKLLKENEELGKIISSGNVAQLEHDLAYHKEILNEACENEQNINSFLSEMDNEMEAMQATILHLNEKILINEGSSNNGWKNRDKPEEGQDKNNDGSGIANEKKEFNAEVEEEEEDITGTLTDEQMTT